MSEPADLNPQNQTYRLFERFSQQSNAIVIASISLLAAVLSALLAALAIFSATSAGSKVDYELEASREEVRNLHRSTELWRAHTVVLRARMEAAGLEVPPLPDEKDNAD